MTDGHPTGSWTLWIQTLNVPVCELTEASTTTFQFPEEFNEHVVVFP